VPIIIIYSLLKGTNPSKLAPKHIPILK